MIFLGLISQALSPPCTKWSIWSFPTNMSTASTPTTLAEPDLTLGDDDKIANQICMLVATHTDGTPLCPTSFYQEDAVAMCEGLNQKHLKGVLWLRDIETVLVFQSNFEMMATMHWVTVAMVWQ